MSTEQTATVAAETSPASEWGPTDVQHWIDTRDEHVTANLGTRLDDGDVLRALCVQRLYIQNREDAAEASRRAWKDPELALTLAEDFLFDVDVPEWSPRAWWRFDFDAAKARKDAEAIRTRARIVLTAARCPECESNVYLGEGIGPEVTKKFLCPQCDPSELAATLGRMEEAEEEARRVEGRAPNASPRGGA